jgi:AAA+ ATPase superfamily predicted ATPase
MSLQLLVFIAQRLDGTRPTREFRAGQNGSNQPFSHGKYVENKNSLPEKRQICFRGCFTPFGRRSQTVDPTKTGKYSLNNSYGWMKIIFTFTLLQGKEVTHALAAISQTGEVHSGG